MRIEDEITQPAGTVIWRAFTDAQAEVKDNPVLLRKNGSQITLQRINTAGIWTITDAKPPTDMENPNKKFRAVVLTIPKAEGVSVDRGNPPVDYFAVNFRPRPVSHALRTLL